MFRSRSEPRFFGIKFCFLEPEPVGAELLKVVLEPTLFTWEPKKKYLEAEPRKNGLAPQHWSLESESEPREFFKEKTRSRPKKDRLQNTGIY